MTNNLTPMPIMPSGSKPHKKYETQTPILHSKNDFIISPKYSAGFLRK